jgi:uncharacterized protein YndB with AHSA1/START domain
MSKHKSVVEFPSDREMVFTRVVDAPRELVWEVYTNPAHVVHWWGPQGFTNTIHEMDVRVGGLWRLTMHGPDGTNYPNRITFLEVVKPERLVYDHGDGTNPRVFHVTTTFSAEGDRTKIVSRLAFPTAAACDAVKGYGIAGHNSAMERLDAYLAQTETAAREIVNTREFAASCEAVFAAFSDPTRLAQWWGPNGFTNTIHEFDLRPGGAWRLTMHGPNGADYHNESRFLEVVRPDRIVFQHEEPVHRFSMTMTFAARDRGMTLTWRMRFESAAEVAQIGSFIRAANEQNFDRLAAHLAVVS